MLTNGIIMAKRRPGQKLPTNLSKIAIMLFLRQDKKTTKEILDHLKEQHGLSESRGIRKHLGELKRDSRRSVRQLAKSLDESPSTIYK